MKRSNKIINYHIKDSCNHHKSNKTVIQCFEKKALVEKPCVTITVYYNKQKIWQKLAFKISKNMHEMQCFE